LRVLSINESGSLMRAMSDIKEGTLVIPGEAK